MAKILVADDNSNIQKMVGLALKDQGIDVVAVGNGEAAVRKISDIKPDLVLADIFMPVRNGYEVCQYVKTDPALAHIPVILLVGAFDPLDEQEAQRVGADGVLKKPFVPPDPLISMVKSALTRAGVAHGANAARIPEPEPVKAREFPGPRIAAVPPVGRIAVPETPVEEPVAALDSGSFVDEVPVRPEPIRFDSGSQPVAFGSLLETPAEKEEQDPAFVASVLPELERDWRDKDVAETDEEEEEEKPAAAWRPAGAESLADADSSATAANWRAGGFEIKARKSEYEAWESQQEKPNVVEAARTNPEVSGVVEESRESATTVPVVTPSMPAAPFSADTWALVAANSPHAAETETVTAVEDGTHRSAPVDSSSQATAVGTPEAKQSEPEQKPASSPWYSATSSPWDAEMEKANKLASAWDSRVPAPVPSAASNGAEKVSNESSEAASATIEQAALPAAAVEAIREEAAQVAEDVVQSSSHAARDAVSAGAPPDAPQAPTPNMDDLVAKVLAKISPEVLQAVTREILRPVVEAMVKEELKSKKS